MVVFTRPYSSVAVEETAVRAKRNCRHGDQFQIWRHNPMTPFYRGTRSTACSGQGACSCCSCKLASSQPFPVVVPFGAVVVVVLSARATASAASVGVTELLLPASTIARWS